MRSPTELLVSGCKLPGHHSQETQLPVTLEGLRDHSLCTSPADLAYSLLIKGYLPDLLLVPILTYPKYPGLDSRSLLSIPEAPWGEIGN